MVRRWVLVLVACLGLAVLEALQGRVRFSDVAWSTYWGPALRRTVASWVLLAFLVPAVAAWAHRFRRPRQSFPVVVLAHVVGLAAFLPLHLGGTAWSVRWLFPERSIRGEWGHLVYTYATMEVFIYLTIVGVVHMQLAQSEARSSERRALELEASLSRAELARLRSQVNPHFLFNALHSVAALADQQDPGRVREALASLASLLRRSLATADDQEVPLRDELEFLDDYLALQTLRFGPRMSVVVDVEPGTPAISVPSLLLQPLVENALRYGVEQQPGAGDVAVRIRRDAESLVIRVENSGPGFGSAALVPGQGIGLENARRRLQQLYGKAHSLRTGDRDGGGAFVEIRLPIRPAPTPGRRA